MRHPILFVGGGNMAASLISGLCQANWAPDQITVIDPDAAKRRALTAEYGVQAAAQATPEMLAVDVVVLAVKPQVMADAARALADRLGAAKPLVVSIAAGVSLAALRAWLGAQHRYVRCMPNTPSLIGAGATGLYADDNTGPADRELAEKILATAGRTVWVEQEAQIDAVTATSGSGPAYFFAFMEAMQAGAEELGLDSATARELVLHTALGAARMAVESGDDPGTLRAKVTSPGGTTQHALACFAEGDLETLVKHAMRAAQERAAELAHELNDG